jgi:hypothetical protein
MVLCEGMLFSSTKKFGMERAFGETSGKVSSLHRRRAGTTAPTTLLSSSMDCSCVPLLLSRCTAESTKITTNLCRPLQATASQLTDWMVPNKHHTCRLTVHNNVLNPRIRPHSTLSWPISGSIFFARAMLSSLRYRLGSMGSFPLASFSVHTVAIISNRLGWRLESRLVRWH